jgi:hypothetical protein
MHMITPTKEMSRVGAYLGKIIFHEWNGREVDCEEYKDGQPSSLVVAELQRNSWAGQANTEHKSMQFLTKSILL